MGLQYVQLLLAIRVCNICSFRWLYGSAICAVYFRYMGLQNTQLLLIVRVSKYAASVDSMGLQYMFSTSPYYAETYINNTE